MSSIRLKLGSEDEEVIETRSGNGEVTVIKTILISILLIKQSKKLWAEGHFYFFLK